MIEITEVAPGQFILELSIAGASFPQARLFKDDLPKSLLVAMVATRMSGVGSFVLGVGVMVEEGRWNLEDGCLAQYHLDDDG